ncbi:MAG: hypothetical protein QM703_00690 [Gemmatales bacterium]
MQRNSYRLISLLFTSLLCIGCLLPLNTSPMQSVQLPHDHEFRRGNLIFHNDADISENHPLFMELASFPEQVCRTLNLPVTDKPIHIYLFKDRVSYEQYVQMEFKDIPSRRALFVMRPGTANQKQEMLQVLCFWGDRIQDDLRHELTHATLHGILHNLPLWLDEGLAMYFEVGIAAQGKHQRALAALEPQIKAGNWKYDLDRLETLKEVDQMGLVDYYEAWAWVYYLMHSDAANAGCLHGYLKDRQRPNAPATTLQQRWSPLGAVPGQQLPEYLKKLLDERSTWPHG